VHNQRAVLISSFDFNSELTEGFDHHASVFAIQRTGKRGCALRKSCADQGAIRNAL
jgi:hypothetical protein